MRSPSQQVGEGQPGAAELVVEPDTEVVQGHPRRQSSPQTPQFVRPLPPQAESVEQLIVDAFDDLSESGHPPPQAFGAGLSGVALGRLDDLGTIVIKPAPMVFGTLETFVGHVSSREGRAHAYEPGVRICPELEEGLCKRLVGSRGRTEAKARDHAGGFYGGQKGETLVPAQAVGPADVGPSGKPSTSPAFRIANGHRRGVQGLVRRLRTFHDPRQVQGHLLDRVCTGAHEPVELRAVGQGGEGASEMSLGVAVEVSLAGESRPAGEDSQGNNLTRGEGGLGAGASLFGEVGLAEVVDHNVECGEEGVHVEHRSVPFPSGSGGKPTLERGRLPLKFRTDNSHQASLENTNHDENIPRRIGPYPAPTTGAVGSGAGALAFKYPTTNTAPHSSTKPTTWFVVTPMPRTAQLRTTAVAGKASSASVA